jgi:hypothetical protein
LTSRLQDLLGALDGQAGDLLAQGLAGLDGLLLGFGARGGDDLGGFFAGAALGFFHHLLGQALGIGQALGSVVAGSGKLLLPRACWQRPDRPWPCRRRSGRRRSSSHAHPGRR